MKHTAVLIFFLLLSTKIFSQEKFCESYNCQSTIDFFEGIINVLGKKAEKFNVNQQEIVSILAPELTMFIYNNKFNIDFVETSAAELFYVKMGSDYGNFSLGYFQMKPLFIEKIEDELRKDSILNKKYKHLIEYELGFNVRHLRIKRIKDLEWALDYANAFYEITSKKLSTNAMDPVERVKLLATAYNRGFEENLQEINRWINRKHFPRCFSCSEKFAYSEIALYYYDYFSTINRF